MHLRSFGAYELPHIKAADLPASDGSEAIRGESRLEKRTRTAPRLSRGPLQAGGTCWGEPAGSQTARTGIGSPISAGDHGRVYCQCYESEALVAQKTYGSAGR